MTTTFKSRNPATCKSNTQIQKISSPKFQQVCCWLALKIKPWWKKKKKIRSAPSSRHHNQCRDWSGHGSISAKNPKLQICLSPPPKSSGPYRIWYQNRLPWSLWRLLTMSLRCAPRPRLLGILIFNWEESVGK